MKTNSVRQGFQILICMIALGLPISAPAQSPGSYDIQIAKVQGDVNCTVNLSDTSEFSCNIQINGRRKINVQMTLQTSKEPGSGYTGKDETVEAESTYMLAIQADASRSIQEIALVTQKNGIEQRSELNATTTKTHTVEAVIVSPLVVDTKKSGISAVKLHFLAYKSAESVDLVSQSDDILRDSIMQKITPLFKYIQR